MDLNRIAEALRMIADAIEAPEKQVWVDPGPEVIEPETSDEQEPVEEVRLEVTLAMLQELGGQLIKGGKRDQFMATLKDMGAKNLSSLDPADYANIHQLLQAL